MAVQSSPSQQPLGDHLRMSQNMNTETLSMSAPFLNLAAHNIQRKSVYKKLILRKFLILCVVIKYSFFENRAPVKCLTTSD